MSRTEKVRREGERITQEQRGRRGRGVCQSIGRKKVYPVRKKVFRSVVVRVESHPTQSRIRLESLGHGACSLTYVPTCRNLFKPRYLVFTPIFVDRLFLGRSILSCVSVGKGGLYLFPRTSELTITVSILLITSNSHF